MAASPPKPPVAIQFFDTRRNALADLDPIEPGKIRLYVCGPTVYDDAHLGHARCYITWDVLVRFLRRVGYHVTYVRNVTDVDDKIINRARSEGSSPGAIADTYWRRFEDDMTRLNVARPDRQPRATEHIETMHQAIAALIDAGAAYQTPQGVYFRVAACAHYGELSKKSTADLKAGARVEVDEQKESPLDFALWKCVADDDDCAWDSPWGRGRPGWHIECSAMNYAELGKQIDIHAGGADLMFPHHENEIAQTECWTHTRPFARHWMHNGFVNVSGEKMSKSLGNFATVRTLLTRYDANTIRYFLLQHHYRMPVDFNDEALQGAENRIKKIHRLWRHWSAALALSPGQVAAMADAPLPLDQPQRASDTLWQWTAELASDLNTPRALALVNQRIGELEQVPPQAPDDARLAELALMMGGLGFDLSLALSTPSLPTDGLNDLLRSLTGEAAADTAEGILQRIIDLRAEAKAARDWAQADRIRDGLAALGVALRDQKDGPTTYEMIG